MKSGFITNFDNDEFKYECCACGSSDVTNDSPPPATETIWQEQYDSELGDCIEKPVEVATESYLSLTCNNCGQKTFEAL